MKDITRSVLEFWLGPKDTTEPQEFWFKSTEALDQEIRDRFLHVHHDAATGVYDNLAVDSDDFLALVIILDQFPRNMFRGQAKAFETDPLALAWAKQSVSKGYDIVQPPPHRRMFFYLPFEHSENLDDQREAVRLFTEMGASGYTKYAIAHQKVIEEFGRFPHRNAALGRTNTDDEENYLSKPGAGF